MERPAGPGSITGFYFREARFLNTLSADVWQRLHGVMESVA